MPQFMILLILCINLLNLSWIKMSIFEEFRGLDTLGRFSSFLLHGDLAQKKNVWLDKFSALNMTLMG